MPARPSPRRKPGRPITWPAHSGKSGVATSTNTAMPTSTAPTRPVLTP